MSWQEFDSLGYWNHGEKHFTFIDELRIEVNHELSEMLFDGRKEFNYHFSNKKLLLVSLDELKTFSFDYELDHSILNLRWEHPHFVGLQLMPFDKLDKTTSQNLPKN